MQSAAGTEQIRREHQRQGRESNTGVDPHLIQPPLVLSQVRQADSVCSLKELPQHLYNCVDVPSRMVCKLGRHMFPFPAFLPMYCVHGWNGHSISCYWCHWELLCCRIWCKKKLSRSCCSFHNLQGSDSKTNSYHFCYTTTIQVVLQTVFENHCDVETVLRCCDFQSKLRQEMSSPCSLSL